MIFRILSFLLLNVELAWSLIYNVTYEITNVTVTPDLSVTWFPPDAWTADNNGFNNDGSARQTDVQGATMNFTFDGRAVYLIGVKAPTSSLFSVIIDNGAPQYRNINSNTPNVYVFRQMLFDQEGLDPSKTHSFLANQSSAGSHLSLNQIIITKDTDVTPTSSGSTPSATSPPETAGTTSHTSKVAIIGGVVGAVVAVIAIGVAIFLWLRLRKAKSFEEYAPAAVQQNYGPVDLWEPPANPTTTTTSAYTYPTQPGPISMPSLSHAPSMYTNPTTHNPSGTPAPPPYNG